MLSNQPSISFKEAIELGKYQEEYLSQFKEWAELDRQLQYRYIRQALNNRRRQLRVDWALLANQPNFSIKPHLQDAQKKFRKLYKTSRLMKNYSWSNMLEHNN